MSSINSTESEARFSTAPQHVRMTGNRQTQSTAKPLNFELQTLTWLDVCTQTKFLEIPISIEVIMMGNLNYSATKQMYVGKYVHQLKIKMYEPRESDR